MPAKSRTHRRFGFYFRFFRIDRQPLRRLIAAVKARLNFERRTDNERKGKNSFEKIFSVVFFFPVTRGVNWFEFFPFPRFFSFSIIGAMCAGWCVSISQCIIRRKCMRRVQLACKDRINSTNLCFLRRWSYRRLPSYRDSCYVGWLPLKVVAFTTRIQCETAWNLWMLTTRG